MIYEVVPKRLRRFGREKDKLKKFRINYNKTKRFPNDLMEKVYIFVKKLGHNYICYNYVVKPV